MRKKSFIHNWILAFIDLRRLANSPQIFRYLSNLRKFRKMGGVVRVRDTYPCLGDRSGTTPFDSHYFYQTAWVARLVAQKHPAHHVDVGSHNMFVAVLSAFVECTFIDYRPLAVNIPNMQSLSGSILQLPLRTHSVLSLSCLHVIEHIGLGRYGDSLAVDGHISAAQELQRVLAPGGHLYIATPVGRACVKFDAHRVFAPDEIASWMPELEMRSFGAVDDSGQLHEICDYSRARDCQYACGLYEFVRR